MTENHTSQAVEEMRIKFGNVIVGIEEIAMKYQQMEQALEAIAGQGIDTAPGDSREGHMASVACNSIATAARALAFDPLKP